MRIALTSSRLEQGGEVHSAGDRAAPIRFDSTRLDSQDALSTLQRKSTARVSCNEHEHRHRKNTTPDLFSHSHSYICVCLSTGKGKERKECRKERQGTNTRVVEWNEFMEEISRVDNSCFRSVAERNQLNSKQIDSTRIIGPLSTV
mmetsp:Transcript_19141/g.19441  ORF Transcript_19141/g.19441 Transcript_19141/m.19441 type:complete len:146 (-) Transcript_19141:169-606(-)